MSIRTKTSAMIAFIVLAITVAACGGDDMTRVQLTIERGATPIDGYHLRVASPAVMRSALADVVPSLSLVVPDDMAGTATTIDVWGLQLGTQRGYGKVTVMPALHATVEATVTLTEVSCGLWCEPESVVCEGDGVSTCKQDENGCFVRGEPVACPAATPYCSNGTCAVECSDECEASDATCDSAVAVRICGHHDSDSCLDWSSPTACQGGESCSDGACTETPTCSDGDDCDDGNPCTTDDTCSGGVCSGTSGCTEAPLHATPTCEMGACGFACDAGFQQMGEACVFVDPAPLPSARESATVVAAGGRIYVIGGTFFSSGNVHRLDLNQAYDPGTNTWQTLAPMPTARSGAAGVLAADGRIYVIGGRASNAALATVEAYDPVANTWTARAALPTARHSLGAAVGSDGRIYAVGGEPSASVVEAYNPTTNTWATRAPLPTGRSALAVVSTGGRIYAIGGYVSAYGSASVVESYDPATNIWTPRESLTHSRSSAGAAIGADGDIWVFGGYVENVYTVASYVWQTEAYRPALESWREGAEIPTLRMGLGAARAPNQLIYVIGGTTSTEKTTVEAFDPVTNTWR